MEQTAAPPRVISEGLLVGTWTSLTPLSWVSRCWRDQVVEGFKFPLGVKMQSDLTSQEKSRCPLSSSWGHCPLRGPRLVLPVSLRSQTSCSLGLG